MEISMFRFIIGLIFIVLGIVVFFIQMYGVFRFVYAFNRMHAAAMGDTMGIGLVLLGLMIMFGFSFTTLKLGLILIFLWCSSPVSSHLIAQLLVETDEDKEKHLEIMTLAEAEDRLAKKSMETNIESNVEADTNSLINTCEKEEE